MSGKDFHRDGFGPGFWLAAGVGTAMLAGHMMLRMARVMHEAGAPARAMMRGPFGAASLKTDATETAKPAPKARPRAKAKAEASEAEVVAPMVPPIPTPTEVAVEVAKATEPFVAAAKETLDAATETVVALMPRAPEEVAPPEEPAALAEMLEPETQPAPEAEPEAEPESASESPAEAEMAAVEAEPAEEPGPAPIDPARPTALAEARGAADDLKLIKGVGPKLAEMLNGLGYYHFDQIAAWGPEELAQVDESLGGFAGRATRDDWIGQARALAKGEKN